MRQKLDRNNVENLLSLTSLQMGILYHYISSEDITEYHEQLTITIEGDLHFDLFQKSWDLVIQENEMLRTIFRWEGIEHPVQIVLKNYKLPIQYIDIINQADKENEVNKIKEKDLSNRIDISEESLRIYLIRLDYQKYKMIMSNNHILFDGWSTGIILKELMNYYTSLYKGEKYNTQNKEKFGKFIKYLENLDKEKQKKYWCRYLNNIDFVNDYFAYNGEKHYKECLYQMEEMKLDKIKTFGKNNKISMAAILYGSFGILLQKLSNTDDIIFGTTVSGRTETIRSIDSMVGLFINTVPLRVISDNKKKALDLISEVEQMLNDRKENENTPLTNIKEYSGLRADKDLFHSLVVIENYPFDTDMNKENILSIGDFEIVERNNYNLTLEILTFENIQLKFIFNDKAVDENLVARLGRYFEKIIDELLENSEIRILDINLLEEDEKNQILYEFNPVIENIIEEKTLQELFEEQALAMPDALAAVFNDIKITFDELNKKSNQLARNLRKKGVKANSIVGILADQTPETLIALLGIIKAGGAYLIVNESDLEKDLVHNLLKDNCHLLLIANKKIKNIVWNGNIINLFDTDVFFGNNNNLIPLNHTNDLAFISIHNGSADKSKVIYKHKNLIQYAFQEYYKSFRIKTKAFLTKTMTSDLSNFEIWAALLNGMELYIPDSKAVYSPNLLNSLIINNQIEAVWLNQEFYNYMAEKESKIFSTIKFLFIYYNGYIEPEYISKVKDINSSIHLIFCYIPFEFMTFPIMFSPENNGCFNTFTGKPNANINVYILNKENRIVPVGFYGELYIRENDLERINQTNKKLEKQWAKNPYKQDKKIFKTGNVARWMPNGELEILEEIKNNTNSQELQLVIAATFTAEPIETYLKWWCKQFKENILIKFAPYNQVFQQLIDTTSIMSVNKGINVLLVRFEDWIRELNLENEQMKVLEDNYEFLIKTLDNQSKESLFFIGIFPTAPHLKLSNMVTKWIENLKSKLCKYLKNKTNFFIIDFLDLDKLYEIEEIYDPIKDKTAHISFTDEYYAAIGTKIARKICAVLKPSPFKVIVLDCDNTLWKGNCGEVGFDGIKINKQYKEFQQLLIKKQKEGMLLALCSKNNENDVWDVFNKNDEMLIKRSHLAAWRINWKNKWDNIKEIAKELNLGLDSFLFIDDSNLECSQVMINCPEVLTVKLPDDDRNIALFLKHIWAFDREIVTIEDKNRTQMYHAQKLREKLQQETVSIENYLKSLKIKMSMKPIDENEIGRISQLTQRTNQFNSSTIRRTEIELNHFIKAQSNKSWGIKVSDKFGEYGLVGVILAEIIDKVLIIDTFLLSCRALGKKIEYAMLHGIYQYYRKNNLLDIIMKVLETTKNEPFIQFIENGPWTKIEQKDKFTYYKLKTNNYNYANEYVECYFDCDYKMNVNKESERENISESENRKDLYLTNKVEHGKWEVVIENKENLFYFNYLTALQLHTGEKLLKLSIKEELDKFNPVKAKYEAPANEVEERLASLWSSLLKIDNIGRNDNFFDLGGNSLIGVTLISKIHKEFNVEVKLGNLFKSPVLKLVAKEIMKCENSVYLPIKQVEESAEYKVSSAQKRIFALHQFNKDSVIYNITDVIKINGMLDKQKINEIFKSLVKRHDAFRTYFEVKAGEVVQKIQKEVDFNIEYEEMEETDEFQIKESISKFVRPFDLSKAPLLRVKLLKSEARKYILMMDMHHIISDGTSMRILMMEFTKMYKGEKL